MAIEGRNQNVELAVNRILNGLDSMIDGVPLRQVITPRIASIYDSAIASAKGSVRLAMTFFISYAVTSDDWDHASVPIGIRGTYGDKKLAAGLTRRHVTLHMNVTAFGENLGWKGNVRNVDLRNDPRFNGFLNQLQSLSNQEKLVLLDHAIWKLNESRAVPQAMPPLPAGYLTYARALSLCEDLLAIRSEGHVQQFLVAAFLASHRARLGHAIRTHHPHAADTYDGTCGDIEEFRDETLVMAYEVTVRGDWKNRLPDFGQKMAEGGLSKYVIIASDVHSDPDLASARQLLEFTQALHFDLAVVDIRDFFCVFCAELSRDEIATSINLAYEFLLRPDLCGRSEFQREFQAVVGRWMVAM